MRTGASRRRALSFRTDRWDIRSSIVLPLALGAVFGGCDSGASETDAADADAELEDSDRPDAPFLDTTARDTSLPCEDQEIRRVRIEGAFDPVEQRYVMAAAADDRTMVLVWADQLEAGGFSSHVGRIPDPRSPRLERVSEPLPLPGVAGAVPAATGVRLLFSDEPGGIGQPIAWAALAADGTLGPLTPFPALPSGTTSLGYTTACRGETGDGVVLFVPRSTTNDLGLLPGVFEGDSLRFLEPWPGLPEERFTVYSGCVVADGVVTAFAAFDAFPPTVVRWRVADGRLLGTPVAVPADQGTNLLTRDAEGTLLVRFEGTDSPIARAYRLSVADVTEAASRSLDPVVGATSLPPRPVGVLPVASGTALLYDHADMLFLLPFSASSGFGTAQVLTDAACRTRSDVLVTTDRGTFLPCAEWDSLYLISLCQSEGT